MSKIFKPDIIPAHFVFPYDLSLFIEPIQAVFSLLSQIIGLDSEKLVTEVMVGSLCLVSQSMENFCLKYDDFLVERISSQVENFHSSGKIFIYQTLLMLIVINNL